MKTDQSLLLKMYRQMLRIRMIEDRLCELWDSEQLKSLVHLSTGQEAVAVGVCAALNTDDSAMSTHRCHAHYLAKGGSLKAMLAELAGKADGCCGGRGGSMHLIDPEVGMNLSVPLVGGSIPSAVGIGLAIKLKGQKRVSVAFLGDGAVEEGVFWESLNFASVFKLPVVFVCENNLYATHSHILKRQPSMDIAERISPHGIYSVKVDGNNALAVYLESKKMVGLARDGQGPSFLEAKTYRWKEHWGSGEDWHLGYRSKEEGDRWRERCPIKIAKEYLDTLGQGENLDWRGIEDSIRAEIEEAIEFAISSPEPIKEAVRR